MEQLLVDLVAHIGMNLYGAPQDSAQWAAEMFVKQFMLHLNPHGHSLDAITACVSQLINEGHVKNLHIHYREGFLADFRLILKNDSVYDTVQLAYVER